MLHLATQNPSEKWIVWVWRTNGRIVWRMNLECNTLLIYSHTTKKTQVCCRSLWISTFYCCWDGGTSKTTKRQILVEISNHLLSSEWQSCEQVSALKSLIFPVFILGMGMGMVSWLAAIVPFVGPGRASGKIRDKLRLVETNFSGRNTSLIVLLIEVYS